MKQAALVIRLSLGFVLLSASIGLAQATELVRLSPQTWDAFVLPGKEADAIYGDLVLRNDRLTLVIAAPRADRNANMTVRDVGGAIIDCTRRDEPNDQLSAFYPGGGVFKFHGENRVVIAADGKTAPLTDQVIRARSIEVRIGATQGPCQAVVVYRLNDESDFVEVSTEFENSSDTEASVPLRDSIRADQTFNFGVAPEANLFWADDEWFRQSYGLRAPDHPVSHSGSRGVVIRYREEPLTLAPQAKQTLTRQFLVQSSLVSLRGQGQQLAGKPVGLVALAASDPNGPVAHALIEAYEGDQRFASARTGADGRAALRLPHGAWQLKVAGQGRPRAQVNLVVDGDEQADLKLEPCGYIEAEFADEAGKPIAVKVAFHGIDGAADPDYGPESAAYGVMNLQYTANGRFKAEIAPGNYEVLISHGPEHDSIAQIVEVQPNRTSKLSGMLRRTVQTPGWISADFHSHSSPSGDNTGSQRGRVLNLLAEHIEFGPCTEHNRISTYVPHLRELGAEAMMATCSGMELTGNPLVINHQNAFPLTHKPRTQDGGGPQTDINPEVQIKRLAMWENSSKKLVQVNHPNLVQIVGDKDQDGKYDGGFEGMLPFMDVVEVHPLAGIFSPPLQDPAGRNERNPVFHWLQMLNLGHRVTGVINTDAHYNYHESGWRRNFVASKTDVPAEVRAEDIVDACEAGHVVMSNGPYLNVSMEAEGKSAIPGDDLAAPSGETTIRIQVQCPNWLDVNRVQVFLNGRPSGEHNFTRREHPKQFTDTTVKYDRRFTLKLKSDTHVIVAAAGERLTLGRIMGPRYGTMMPIAVSNPIYVDVDGNGFQPNGDLLDVPLPHKQ
ncbi:MAG: CehA/McbA family metallohydrolase [Planctomycetales bacterium]|nr:CehA/McbA family metallohydrolase [Planctomycetales bacterium]